MQLRCVANGGLGQSSWRGHQLDSGRARWLDRASAAAYLEVRLDRLQPRRCRQDPRTVPSYVLGPRSPRWDRLAALRWMKPFEEIGYIYEGYDAFHRGVLRTPNPYKRWSSAWVGWSWAGISARSLTVRRRSQRRELVPRYLPFLRSACAQLCG